MNAFAAKQKTKNLYFEKLKQVKTIEKETNKKSMKDCLIDHLNLAVSNGKITQEQADEAIDIINSFVDGKIELDKFPEAVQEVFGFMTTKSVVDFSKINTIDTKNIAKKISEAVDSGILTQDQAEMIFGMIDNDGNIKFNGFTITDEIMNLFGSENDIFSKFKHFDMDALPEIFTDDELAEMQENISDLLKELLNKAVENGKITDEKAAEMTDKFFADGIIDREKINSVIKEYFNIGENIDIHEYFKNLADDEKEVLIQDFSDKINEIIINAIENGKITQEQADKIISKYFINGKLDFLIISDNVQEKFKNKDLKTFFDGISDENGEKFVEMKVNFKEKFIDKINELLSNGLITQEQADNALDILNNFENGDKIDYSIFSHEIQDKLKNSSGKIREKLSEFNKDEMDFEDFEGFSVEFKNFINGKISKNVGFSA